MIMRALPIIDMADLKRFQNEVMWFETRIHRANLKQIVQSAKTLHLEAKISGFESFASEELGTLPSDIIYVHGCKQENKLRMHRLHRRKFRGFIWRNVRQIVAEVLVWSQPYTGRSVIDIRDDSLSTCPFGRQLSWQALKRTSSVLNRNRTDLIAQFGWVVFIW